MPVFSSFHQIHAKAGLSNLIMNVDVFKQPGKILNGHKRQNFMQKTRQSTLKTQQHGCPTQPPPTTPPPPTPEPVDRGIHSQSLSCYQALGVD